MNKSIRTILIIVVVIAVFVGLFIWSRQLRPADSEVVSTNGIHWHPTLTITAQGKPITIPPNIGLGTIHQPIHTHDEDAAQGVIHLEFSGIVKRQDITLGQFFKNWDKDMRSFGQSMVMKVNGVENTDYENYVFHETDKIELIYE